MTSSAKGVTFAKFCMKKGGGGVQQKVTNDDKTLRVGGIIIIIDCYIKNKKKHNYLSLSFL